LRPYVRYIPVLSREVSGNSNADVRQFWEQQGIKLAYTTQ